MSTPRNSHYFSQERNETEFQQQQQPQQQVHFVIPEPTEFDSMMEQRTTMMNTPDFGPLQANHLYYGQASPSSPLLHHILQQQQQHTAPSQDQHHQQQEQKDDRTRFVMRLAILLQRLNKMAENHQHKGDSFSSCYHHPAAPSTTTISGGATTTTEEIVTSQLLIRRVKQLVRYATQRNRLGDPRFSPLVESIEQCLADLVGCDEWFSICLEAEQRHRVRQISHTMMIVSSTMMLGSANNNNNNNSVLQSSSTSSSSGVGLFKPTPNNNFPASFFP